MSDLIDRQAAIDAIRKDVMGGLNYEGILKRLPSAQSEMIREIRKWINSGNRGSADYFIVDKIEEIINKYE